MSISPLCLLKLTRTEVTPYLLSGYRVAYFILCSIKRHWCLLTESADPLFRKSSSSLLSNWPALEFRDPNLWALRRTAWTSCSLFVVMEDESMLSKTLWILVTIMFNGSSGSSAKRGSKPSRSICSARAQMRRADILGVFTYKMETVWKVLHHLE